MLQRSKFTVTYDVDGGSAVASQQVLNGEYATKPQDPKKDGYAFIGWYTDKDYTSAFVFDSVAVKKDTTVYARFEQLTGKSEYTATLVGGDASYAPAKTVNGVLYNLPTPAAKDGAAFIGWWMSDYQKPDKLTAQYEGQTLAGYRQRVGQFEVIPVQYLDRIIRRPSCVDREIPGDTVGREVPVPLVAAVVLDIVAGDVLSREDGGGDGLRCGTGLRQGGIRREETEDGILPVDKTAPEIVGHAAGVTLIRILIKNVFIVAARREAWQQQTEQNCNKSDFNFHVIGVPSRKELKMQNAFMLYIIS